MMNLSPAAFNDSLMQQITSLLNLSRCLTWDEFAAKDLVQDTLYRALKNRNKFEAGTNMGAWLHTILRHIFINDFRHRKIRSALFSEHVDDIEGCRSGTFAQNHGLANMRLQEIKKAIFELPTCFRNAFEMYFAGYKYHEIARIQKVPLGTVKSRIFFARKALLERLKNET